jgi:hypothetical protein
MVSSTTKSSSFTSGLGRHRLIDAPRGRQTEQLELPD